MKNLPTGWVETTIGEVAEEPVEQRPPERGSEFTYVDISSIDREVKRVTSPQRLSGAAAPTRAKQRLRIGDVVVSMTRPNLNAVAYITNALEGATGSTGFCILRSRYVNGQWLFYRVQSADFVSAMSALVQGALYPAVRPKDIYGFELTLPPVPEQGRIVAEIEKQFTRLDDAVAALKRVQANLKRYRASVLKAACEGRLVPTEAQLARKEKRSYEPASDLLKRISSSDEQPKRKKRAGRLWGSGVVPELTVEERAGLPAGWSWAKVRDLGPEPDDVVQVGPMSMRSQDFEPDGTPVLNVGCVQWGRFDEAKLDHLPLDKAKSFSRYLIEPGDVLFTRSGTVGRCAVAQQHQKAWLMTFHLLRARPSPAICLPEYLRIVFEGASHVRRQTREASIGTTRAGFNTNLLANLDVPLPPLREQERIVTALETELSKVDAAVAAVGGALRRADRLRQSTLKSAFEGKLVPQDPADEPASVLLERIHAARITNSARKIGPGRWKGQACGNR
jgi:type I restriction enzyme S subunit